MPKLVWITETKGEVVAEVEVYERKGGKRYRDRFGLRGPHLYDGYEAAVQREERDRCEAEERRALDDEEPVTPRSDFGI